MLRFRVPASTTNLGHGFDCLGMALGAGNTITVQELPAGAPEPATDAGLRAMTERIRTACAAAWQRPMPRVTVRIDGDVPIARGMGSSSTILLGVAAACQALAGRPWRREELLPLAAEVEGHPDNVAAACLGGFTVVGAVAGGLRWARFDVPDALRAVVAIPPFEVKTSEARAILPRQLTRAESVLAVQRTALIAAALARGDLDGLRGLFAEAWHERHRATLNPGLLEARAAAADAGALGTILSGSGSTVLSFAHADAAAAVSAAIAGAYGTRGVAAELRILGFDNGGIVPA